MRLPKQNICLLQGPSQHHGLLIVNIVIRSPVDHQVLFLVQLGGLRGHVAGLVAAQVVVRRGQAQVPAEEREGLSEGGEKERERERETQGENGRERERDRQRERERARER